MWHPLYYLSLFQGSSSVCKNLEKLMRDFLWEGVDEGRGFHLVGWEVKKGGLELENQTVHNKILLAKWLWCFDFESESLWDGLLLVSTIPILLNGCLKRLKAHLRIPGKIFFLSSRPFLNKTCSICCTFVTLSSIQYFSWAAFFPPSCSLCCWESSGYILFFGVPCILSSFLNESSFYKKGLTKSLGWK